MSAEFIRMALMCHKPTKPVADPVIDWLDHAWIDLIKSSPKARERAVQAALAAFDGETV